MSILFNKNTKVFTLQTKNSSYQMKIGELGVLYHTYYGKKIEDFDLSNLISYFDRAFSGNPYELGKSNRAFSLDWIPQEFSGSGVGDYRVDCIKVENTDGSSAVDLRYVSHEIYDGKYRLKGLPTLYENNENEATTLEIILEDNITNIQVVLMYGVMESLDIITRAVKVLNKGIGAIQLKKIMSACLDFNHNNFDMIDFYGKHAMEREMQRHSLHHGKQSIGSIRGTSSHHYNPFFMLCDPEATETSGDCYGVSFVYSGNFIADVEVDQINQTRAVIGIHPDSFNFNIEVGDSFIAPEVILAYTPNGLGELSRIFHRAYRNNLCRGEYKTKRRPILINNWEATYFAFDSEKLISIAKDAAEVGIEMLVMDDGWFGKRDDDNSGLGDWFVNEKKIQGGLKNLVKNINKAGLAFGIWFEPEMVSENSDLYRLHPDWAFNIQGRPGNLSRNQFVLDFSRADVREYIYERMCDILGSANIVYVKWDMNRSLSNVYSAAVPANRQGEVYHNYVLGLYEIMEKLITQFPHILFEGCSGGGGRFDAGMLYYMPQIWCSDDTDAIERIKIQYGTSFGYPISSMGSHVSACPNHQTGRITPLETRGIVAMAGSFGYELDINKMSREEKNVMKHQIKQFKLYYDVIHNGDYYRLSNPYTCESHAAWEMVSTDKHEALVSIVYTKVYANPAPIYLKVKGLDPEKYYTINDEEQIYPGSVLMFAGLLMPYPKKEYDSALFYIKQIEK